MKSMNYYIIGACLIFAILLYSFVTNAIGFSSDHKFLFRKIYSQETDVYPMRKSIYELTPLIQGEIYRPNYFYLPERNQYLIKSSIDFPNEMDTETGWSDRLHPTKRYLLLNHQGQVQASFDTLINFSRFSGIFFAPDFYIDWLESGSIEPKAYSQIVNKDLSLSQTDFIKAFRELHAQADYVEYVSLRQSTDDDHESGVVFKIKGEWIILLSGLKQSYMSRENNDENPKTGIWDQNYTVMFDYYDKGPQDYPQSPALMQLIPLQSDIEDPYVFRNYPGVGDIKVNKFEKTGSESLFETSGTAYVSVKVKQSTFKFKIPHVLKLSIWPIYNLGVRSFKLSNAKVKNSLVFVEVTQNAGSFGQIREGLGVYVVTERQGENFSIVSDLPEGITEKRFSQLPINLQKALINRDTAHSLVLENYEVDQWLPEIELLENLKYLKITGRMTQLPESISKLSKLQMLDLSMNKIRKLPSSFSQLKHLRYVYLSFTELEKFPAELLVLPELRKLDLGHNPFTEIPAEINQLTHLIELDLSGAKVTKLPDSMAEMKQLTITTGQYSEYHEQFPEKFQHLFVNKVPHRWDPKPSNESTEQTSN
jgi:Leucine rich repeat